MRLIIVVSGIAFLCVGLANARGESGSYQPENHEQFVLSEFSSQAQRSGFRSFCKSQPITYTSCPPLDFYQYAGMKGYFETKDAKIAPGDDPFGRFAYSWPVFLENGERFYYVRPKTLPDKYLHAEILPYKEKGGIFVEPLVDGSSIKVEPVLSSFGSNNLRLSHDGNQISPQKLSYIREISSRFPSQELKIAEALLPFNISYDEVNDQYFIKPSNGTVKSSEAGLYIGLNPTKTWLRMQIRYAGSNWLFVRSYLISADSLRWQSPAVSFKRDHSGGSVWEWIDVAPNTEDLHNMRALAQAKSSIVRFWGDKYYSDLKLSDQQQESISNILSLYEMLKQ